MESLKRVRTEPERVADEVAQRVEDLLGRTAPVRKIRNSQILSGIVAAAGLALFLVGVEKVFINLPGPTSILLGLGFMTLSGALLKKL